jgi:hypothetical protein
VCDFSLQAVKSRAAAIDDKLVTKDFGHGTRGFATVEDGETAVCVLPGTEIAFDEPIETGFYTIFAQELKKHEYKTARFRQLHKDNPHTHHDALELPDGTQVLLTILKPGQTAKVVQLPAAPKTEEEAKEQTRLAVVG